MYCTDRFTLLLTRSVFLELTIWATSLMIDKAVHIYVSLSLLILMTSGPFTLPCLLCWVDYLSHQFKCR